MFLYFHLNQDFCLTPEVELQRLRSLLEKSRVSSNGEERLSGIGYRLGEFARLEQLVHHFRLGLFSLVFRPCLRASSVGFLAFRYTSVPGVIRSLAHRGNLGSVAGAGGRVEGGFLRLSSSWERMEYGARPQTPAAATNVMIRVPENSLKSDSSRYPGVKETSNPSDEGPFGKGRNSSKTFLPRWKALCFCLCI
jgi:hypothetical protein